MQKAFSYLRVSGVGQVSGDGFPRQREAILAYANRHSIELVEEFRDEGVSGCNELENREGLSELVARIASNGVRLVLVERADRLGRDALVFLTIVTQFEKLGVRVVEVQGGNELTFVKDADPTHKLIRTILAAVAEFEKMVTVAKLRTARKRKKAQTGKCEGAKLYGEAREGTSPEDLAREQAVIAQVKVLRSTGLTLQAIADILNNAGHTTKQGKIFRQQQVKDICDRQGETK